MTRPSISLHPSSALQIAVSALAGQGQYGVVTELARTHDLRRQSVYDLRQRARAALEEAFAPGTEAPPSLYVAEDDVRRGIVALRAVMPASIRDIVEVLPVLFDVRYSYGSVWNVLHEAEQRAAAFHRTVDLSGIDAVALDEVFSQGQPVLSGIDLDTGYLLLLAPQEGRSGEQWASVLDPLREDQQLWPSRVVKDAGTGLSSGVKRVWPGIEERDDLFHAVYQMGQQRVRLERRAYRDIATVEDLRHRRTAAQSRPRAPRRSLGQQSRAAKARMEASIERHDRFEALARQATELLELAPRGSGELRTKAEVVSGLTRVAAQMKALGGPQIREVATYLSNRAEGLGLYLDDLAARLSALHEAVGGAPVVHAVVRAYQASLLHSRGGPAWDRTARRVELRVATQQLVGLTHGEPHRLLTALGQVLPVLASRHRASSAIENLHSVLRPYLVVQKHASAGFLDLFRFYWNHRMRRGGRFAGTSAHAMLTGETDADWLTRLGFPPSEARQNGRELPAAEAPLAAAA